MVSLARVYYNDRRHVIELGYEERPDARVDGRDGALVVRGVAPNELTDSRARDPFAGTPWHKCVPARPEKIVSGTSGPAP